MKKRLVTLLVSTLTAILMLTGCGKDVSKMDDAELYAYLMDMDEDEREDFIENLDSEQQYRAYSVLVVGEVTGVSDEWNEQEDNSVKSDDGDSSGKNITYAPTEEIINSTLTDGKIQIGNSVFQQGGFITVGEFDEKYSNEFVFELETTMGEIYCSVNDSKLKIRVYSVRPHNIEDDERIDHSEAIVLAVDPYDEYAVAYTWYAGGVSSVDTGYTKENFTDYYEKNGLQLFDENDVAPPTAGTYSRNGRARIHNCTQSLLGDIVEINYIMEKRTGGMMSLVMDDIGILNDETSGYSDYVQLN